MNEICHFVDVRRKRNKKKKGNIHPKYDAGDQPTLNLQSNGMMKAERANCLRRHQATCCTVFQLLRVITDNLTKSSIILVHSC